MTSVEVGTQEDLVREMISWGGRQQNYSILKRIWYYDQYTMTLLTEKKTHNLKVVSYVLSGDLVEDYNLQDSLWYNLRNSSKEVKEEQDT